MLEQIKREEMNALKGNAIIAQSGGPTAVINNSVAGVVSRWLERNPGGKMYAGLHGVKGFLEENIIDIGWFTLYPRRWDFLLPV